MYEAGQQQAHEAATAAAAAPESATSILLTCRILVSLMSFVGGLRLVDKRHKVIMYMTPQGDSVYDAIR